jgi:hypothetical protein
MIKNVKIDVSARFRHGHEPIKSPYHSGGTIFIYEDDEYSENNQQIKSLEMTGSGHTYFQNGFSKK